MKVYGCSKYFRPISVSEKIPTYEVHVITRFKQVHTTSVKFYEIEKCVDICKESV